MPGHLAWAVANVRDTLRVAVHRAQHIACNRSDRSIPTAGNIEDLANHQIVRGMHDQVNRPYGIIDVDKIPCRASIAMYGEIFIKQNAGYESRNYLLEVLSRAIIVEWADNDGRQVVSRPI